MKCCGARAHQSPRRQRSTSLTPGRNAPPHAAHSGQQADEPVNPRSPKEAPTSVEVVRCAGPGRTRRSRAAHARGSTAAWQRMVYMGSEAAGCRTANAHGSTARCSPCQASKFPMDDHACGGTAREPVSPIAREMNRTHAGGGLRCRARRTGQRRRPLTHVAYPCGLAPPAASGPPTRVGEVASLTLFTAVRAPLRRSIEDNKRTSRRRSQQEPRSKEQPTCVGVLRAASGSLLFQRGTAHVRGGTASVACLARAVWRNSPRAWE